MALELVIVGDVPTSVELAPTKRVVAALTDSVTDLPEGVVNASFVDRAESQDFNVRYSGNDYATDVLSFSYIEDGEAIDGVIGELAICTPIAAEQAEAAKTSLSDEIALLVLHGLLHLCGYDHQTEADQLKVQHLQEQLMSKAGNTYREFVWET
ncbi:rRNA maturation RNase YbeY [Candidatus Saccharibacteria bacterium]|nr:rRNA maturation RNase YbeY [Candidatus Saccharibacteria bacterium]